MKGVSLCPSGKFFFSRLTDQGVDSFSARLEESTIPLLLCCRMTHWLCGRKLI